MVAPPVERHRERFGGNRLEDAGPTSLWKLLWDSVRMSDLARTLAFVAVGISLLIPTGGLLRDLGLLPTGERLVFDENDDGVQQTWREFLCLVVPAVAREACGVNPCMQGSSLHRSSAWR